MSTMTAADPSRYGPAHLLPGTQIGITVDPDTQPFWEAARERRLTVCRCAECGHMRMPPSPVCPECSSRGKSWPTLPGTGRIYSYAVCNRDPVTGAPLVYVPVVVDVDGAPGIRLVANLTGCDAEDVRIGMEVRVAWTEIRDGWVLPNFQVA